MAADDMLLRSQGPSAPVLRFYRWDPACISLGFHQKADCLDMERIRRDKKDVVRRPTGGRAVLHDEEVTYAAVVPAGEGNPRSLAEIYEWINRGLTAGLQKLGVQAQLQKRSPDFHAHYRNALSASCFSAAARYEILVQGEKLVGSAQRKIGGSVLQHGSILLGEGHLELAFYLASTEQEKNRFRGAIQERTTSLSGCLGKNVTWEQAVESLREGFEQSLGVHLEEDEFTDEENRLIRGNEKQFSIYSCGQGR